MYCISLPLWFQVRIFDLTDGNGFRCLHHVDVSRILDKIRDAREADETEDQANDGTDNLTQCQHHKN